MAIHISPLQGFLFHLRIFSIFILSNNCLTEKSNQWEKNDGGQDEMRGSIILGVTEQKLESSICSAL